MSSKLSLLVNLLPILLHVTGIHSQEEAVDGIQGQVLLTFRNELPEPIELFWEGEKERIVQHHEPIPAHGGEIEVTTYPGHTFSYDFGGERHFEETHENTASTFIKVLLGGKTDVSVKCTTTVNGRNLSGNELSIKVIPWWSPRGASWFLHLVRTGYYDGVALNRIVPGFLSQLGIGANYEKRTEYRNRPIPDDPIPNPPVKFHPGMMSYAGSGPDSRTTEVFIVMPNTPQEQLDYFGRESWETPFAFVEDLEESPVSQWQAYGDMPPNGDGPDPHRIYEEGGYEYLEQNFPKMDYIERCWVEEVEVGTTEEL